MAKFRKCYAFTGPCSFNMDKIGGRQCSAGLYSATGPTVIKHRHDTESLPCPACMFDLLEGRGLNRTDSHNRWTSRIKATPNPLTPLVSPLMTSHRAHASYPPSSTTLPPPSRPPPSPLSPPPTHSTPYRLRYLHWHGPASLMIHWLFPLDID